MASLMPDARSSGLRTTPEVSGIKVEERLLPMVEVGRIEVGDALVGGVLVGDGALCFFVGKSFEIENVN